jgi:hypothetical protein
VIFDWHVANSSSFVAVFCLFFVAKIRHDCRMANFTRLRDLYRFPGFVPRDHIRGVFGDPKAVVIPLRRVREKRPAVSVDKFTAPTTTSDLDSSVISRAATSESTSPSNFEGFSAHSVPA